MAEPFLSEIRMFGFGWAPRNWATCDGQSMPINQNQSLYSLLGTTYGGNGQTTFNLPDLRSRVPVHSNGGNTRPGDVGGVESVTLTSNQMASHTHGMRANTGNGNIKTFSSNILASGYDDRAGKEQPVNMYAPAANLVSLNTESVTSNGAGLPHSNMQPSAVVNFCIALNGVFPSRN